MTKTDRLEAVLGSKVRAGVLRTLASLPYGFGSVKLIWMTMRDSEGLSKTSRSNVASELKNLEQMNIVRVHELSDGYAETLWCLQDGDPLVEVFRAMATQPRE